MHKNNFDFLRLLFAAFVIVTHSYTLSGIRECDLMCQLTNEQLSLSYIGVSGFFIISGYLIFLSLFRSKNLIDYFWKRILRLYPALITVLFITVLLAPFIYNNSIPYLSNTEVLTYLPNNLSIFNPQLTIEGIFQNNPHPYIINGSLWTINYEFLFYIGISALIIFRKNTIRIRMILFSAYIFLYIANIFFIKEISIYALSAFNGKSLINMGLYFISGCCLATTNIEKMKHKNMLTLICTGLFFISLYFNIFSAVQHLLLPLIILPFGLSSTKYLSSISSSIGDLSYGIYIYSYPIQQTLVYYFGLNYIELMVSTLILATFFGYLSWHLIEKKALKLKNTNPFVLLASKQNKKVNEY